MNLIVLGRVSVSSMQHKVQPGFSLRRCSRRHGVIFRLALWLGKTAAKRQPTPKKLFRLKMAYSSAVCVPRGFKPAKKNLLGILGIGGAPEPLHPLATPIQC